MTILKTNPADWAETELSIRTVPDPILRQECAPVESFGAELQTFGVGMTAFMKQSKGIGPAGPQIGIPYRIVTVGMPQIELFLINPQVVPVTMDSDTKVEGCLSLPEQSYNVTRCFEVEVKARDAEGKRVHFVAEDLLARVIQHEVDHLDGVMICDRDADKRSSKSGSITVR